jgi:hypothetical protein
MRRAATFLLVLGCTALAAAPAPFLPSRPKPKPANPYWEVDFSPLAMAGNVNVGLILKVRTGAGENALSVSQSGRVNVPAIVGAFSRSYFQKGDLVDDPAQMRMTIKAHKGQPVTGVEVTMRGLAPNFAPVVYRPGERR